MGNLAMDVARPKDMVQGMGIAAIAGLAVNCFTAIGAFVAGSGSWNDGYLAEAFARFWSPLAPCIRGVAALANTLLYMSELTAVAHLVSSMGDPGDDLRLLPACFAQRLMS